MRAYVHIPFCRRRCSYCRFALTTRWDAIRAARYVAGVLAEIEHFFAGNGPVKPQSASVESIYFWGGTPSAIDPLLIQAIIERIAQHAPLKHCAEITIECNPEDISPEWIHAMEELGVNRVSVGIQSLEDNVLSAIERSEAAQARKALNLLSQSSLQTISCDTILGLPHQSKAVVSDLESLLESYRINHMSVYFLEKGETYHASWKESCPGEEDVRIWRDAVETLAATKGFMRYEVSSWAKQGHLCEHNQGYWNHEEIAAFWLSAGGFDGKRTRYQRASEWSAYEKGACEKEQLTDEQLRLERVMFRIRTGSLKWEDIGDRSAAKEYLRSGLIQEGEKGFFLTSTGLFLTDHIIASLA